MWRSICGPNRKHVISERRKLRSKELHNMYSLPYITRVVKLWCMRWAGNLEDTKAIKNTKIFVWGLTVTWYCGVHRHLWYDSNNSNKTGCGDGLQVQLLKTFCWDGSRNCSHPPWAPFIVSCLPFHSAIRTSRTSFQFIINQFTVPSTFPGHINF